MPCAQASDLDATEIASSGSNKDIWKEVRAAWALTRATQEFHDIIDADPCVIDSACAAEESGCQAPQY